MKPSEKATLRKLLIENEWGSAAPPKFRELTAAQQRDIDARLDEAQEEIDCLWAAAKIEFGF